VVLQRAVMNGRRSLLVLAMTKPSAYSDESRLEVRPAHGEHMSLVYPFCESPRARYTPQLTSGWRIMEEDIRLAEFGVEPQHRYSSGWTVRSRSRSKPTARRLLDLVQEPRGTELQQCHPGTGRGAIASEIIDA